MSALSKASSAIVDLAIRIAFPAMKEIRLKISDLFGLDPQRADHPKDLAAITAYVLKNYGFLPKPIAVDEQEDSKRVVVRFQSVAGGQSAGQSCSGAAS